MGAVRPADLSKPIDGMRYEKEGHLALITLDRPERGNSLIPAMHRGFRAIWDDVRNDDAVRVVIITGTGDRHFCTGVDVGGVAEHGMSAGDGPLVDEVFWSPKTHSVWKPVIAAVNGTCAGAGLHFVVEADIIVAAEGVTFLDAHVNVGLVGAIENIGLAKRLPLGTALQMTLMGRDFRLDVERAHQLGLVDRVVPRERLMETAREIAATIARNSPSAVSRSQQAIWGSLAMSYPQALEYGWNLVKLQWSHPDMIEGPKAFVEKRDPVWYSPHGS
jgi:enoyl-CoA hydratase/carnithine racemase